jgi:outer membrane protein TolC
MALVATGVSLAKPVVYNRLFCPPNHSKVKPMETVCRCALRLFSFLLLIGVVTSNWQLWAEPVPLKRVVELALAHSTAAAASAADEQRAFASYHEARNQYLPQLVVGSGLGATWGYPLSLEGSAPSIVNVNAQSALLNPALRDFVRAARSEWKASSLQSKDQRNQVIQDTVLSYAELGKWQTVLSQLQQEYAQSTRMEQIVNERIQEGVDSEVMRNKAQVSTARIRFRLAEAQGGIDILRNRLSQLTGLPAVSIDAIPDSIPGLPEVKQEDDLVTRALQSSPSVAAADTHAIAQNFRARGEHRALWPSGDFAAQYALLATFNNYERFFQPGSFQRHNASLGVVLRLPFLSPTQHAHAAAADAEALRARKDAESAKNQVSEQTLKLQRSVEQLAAAQQVAELEYKIAQANVDATQVRADAGTANLHDVQDARDQANDRSSALQDANFELERARITLLRATGDLESWVGAGK